MDKQPKVIRVVWRVYVKVYLKIFSVKKIGKKLLIRFWRHYIKLTVL